MDIKLAAAACFVGLVIAAAAWDAADAGEDRVRVGYFANVGHAIPIIGVEGGAFESALNGTQIEARIFESGPQAIESMFAGSIDMAYVGPGPAINGHINSKDVVILAGAASGGASMVLHPDADPGSFSLDGARIGAPQIGNTQDVSLRHYVAGLGLAPAERGGTVTIYNLPGPDVYTLFAKGDIDAAWVPEPWATMLVRDLGGHRLFYEEEMWPDGRFATVLLVADLGYARQNPGVVAAWLDAHSEAAGSINADKDGAAGVINGFLEGYLGRGLDPETVRISLANTEITDDPLPGTVAEFARRADSLGYLGRGGYDLGRIYYDAQGGA